MVEKILEEREDGTQEAGRGECSFVPTTKFDLPDGEKGFAGVFVCYLRSVGEASVGSVRSALFRLSPILSRKRSSEGSSGNLFVKEFNGRVSRNLVFVVYRCSVCRLTAESVATAAIFAGRCVTAAGTNALSRFAFSPFVSWSEVGWTRGERKGGRGREARLTGFTLESLTRREKPRRECRTDASRSFSDSLFVAENPRREYKSAVEGARERERETF